jgi:hypothetical protein
MFPGIFEAFSGGFDGKTRVAGRWLPEPDVTDLN